MYVTWVVGEKMVIEQWLSNETTTPKPYVERGSIRDRPNAGGAGDLVRLLHAGRISTVNEGTPYSGRWFFKSSSIGGSLSSGYQMKPKHCWRHNAENHTQKKGGISLHLSLL